MSVVILGLLATLAWAAVLWAVRDVQSTLSRVERRLISLERAGILIHPDGKGDAPLVMSRREKIRLAEKLARQKSGGGSA